MQPDRSMGPGTAYTSRSWIRRALLRKFSVVRDAPSPISRRTKSLVRRAASTSSIPARRSDAMSSRTLMSALRVIRNGTHSRTCSPGKNRSANISTRSSTSM